MSEPIELTSTTTLSAVATFIQTTGFPVFMCLILCAIIYYQNKTNDEMRAEMIKNGIEYNARLTAQDKDAADIKGLIRDVCGEKK